MLRRNKSRQDCARAEPLDAGGAFEIDHGCETGPLNLCLYFRPAAKASASRSSSVGNAVLEYRMTR